VSRPWFKGPDGSLAALLGNASLDGLSERDGWCLGCRPKTETKHLLFEDLVEVMLERAKSKYSADQKVVDAIHLVWP